MTDNQAEEEKLFKKINDDPLIKLKSREVDQKEKEEMLLE